MSIDATVLTVVRTVFGSACSGLPLRSSKSTVAWVEITVPAGVPIASAGAAANTATSSGSANRAVRLRSLPRIDYLSPDPELALGAGRLNAGLAGRFVSAD